MAAGIELFGPDYEVAVEIVPFAGENNLMDALTYENSIRRNHLAHCHEMVMARREWWDEKVFNDYPTWNEAVEDRHGYFGEPAAKNRRWAFTHPRTGSPLADQRRLSRSKTHLR